MTLAKWVTRSGMLLAAMFGVAGCAGSASPDAPSAPNRHDPVYVESTEVLLLESYPVQIMLRVDGQLPDPCHEALWNVSDPDEQGRIDVDLFSVAPDGPDCIQVLAPMTLRIPIGSFKRGSYTIWLNGEQVEAFDLPA